MIIRSARREDAPIIASMVMMAEGEMVPFFTGFEVSEEARREIERYVLSPVPCRYDLEHCLVAEVDGRAAGAILTFPADSQPELDRPILESLRKRGVNLPALSPEGISGTYYLSTMAVAPELRGKGAGSAMLTAGMKRGHELGFDRASLLVMPDKPRARALYERLGFVAAGEHTIADTLYTRMVADVSGM